MIWRFNLFQQYQQLIKKRDEMIGLQFLLYLFFSFFNILFSKLHTLEIDFTALLFATIQASSVSVLCGNAENRLLRMWTNYFWQDVWPNTWVYSLDFLGFSSKETLFCSVLLVFHLVFKMWLTLELLS